MKYIYYRLPEETKIFRRPVLGSESISWTGFDLEKHKGFVVCPFNTVEDALLFKIGEKEEVLARQIKGKIFTNSNELDKYKDEYIANVTHAISKINDTSLEKAVMAQKFTVPIKIDSLDLFHKLCAHYPHGFIYCMYVKDTYWVGASPEMLCVFNDGVGKTVALAGTQDKKSNAWGEKEKEEQEIIQTFMEEEFVGIEDFEFEKGNTRTIRAGAIEHISSIYNFKTNYKGLTSLVKKLHPTPAVCGYPKQLSKDFILKMEGFNRELYSGFLGFNEGNKTSFFVNLRCTKIGESEICLFAGAGITKDSIPVKEWEEILKKTETILGV